MQYVTIGRSSRNRITIRDVAVSRFHCQIVQYDNGTFAIVDFGSTNGTFVNGQRVQGQRPLNYGDVVKIGNTTIPWQNYFSSSTPTPRPNPYKPPKKTTALPVVLGVAGGLLLVALIILLLVKNRTNQESTSHPTICIDNAYIDFGMPLEDIRKQNPNANITPYHVNAVQNNAIYMQELNYYTINNETAIILINNSVAQIFTWSRSYRTLQNTQVGCTMGEVEQACPQLQFFYMGYSYNFRMQKYERAIRAYDPVSCIGYYFYESQFSQQQWSKLYAVAGKVSANGTFSMASISSSVYQSIRSAVTVSIIEIGNCGSTSNVPQHKQEGRGYSAVEMEKPVQITPIVDVPEDTKRIQPSKSQNDFSCLKYRLVKDWDSDKEKLELRNTCNKDIRVKGYFTNKIAFRGGDNRLYFDEIVYANSTKYVDGFIENKCTITSVKKISK